MHGIVKRPYKNVPAVKIFLRPNLSDKGPAKKEPTTMPIVDHDDKAPFIAAVAAF